MISATKNCGCRIEPVPEYAESDDCSVSDESECSCPESDFSDASRRSLESTTCFCGSDAGPEISTKKVTSEIAETGEPYKEIEALVNNSVVIVRVQTERPKPELEPPCTCLEEQESIKSSRGSTITFQKVVESPGCKTVTVYPHPDAKNADSSNAEPALLPVVHPEENPNIFVLKIKRKCDNGDRKHNLDLEFRSPRPWSIKTLCDISDKKPFCPNKEGDEAPKGKKEKKKKGKGSKKKGKKEKKEEKKADDDDGTSCPRKQDPCKDACRRR